jgi:hypothetical protein
MGECDKKQSFALLDEFFKLGGNFIDTYVTSFCLDLAQRS